MSSQCSQFNVEGLESRTFLSAVEFNYPNFASRDHLAMNGFGSSAEGLSQALRLTDFEFHQARSVWYDQAVPIERFRTDFTFRIGKNVAGADGFTFAMINGPTTTLGADGRGLGFGGINVPSEAASLNQFNFRRFGSQFGFATNGERPPTNIRMKNIDLHSGHTFRATVTYDGTEMQVTVVDASDKSKVFTASQQINLAAGLETSDAIVGFTAGTGDNRATHQILSWRFNGEHVPAPAPQPAPAPVPTAPTVEEPADAATKIVITRGTDLSVLASDLIDDESELTYTWAATRLPTGAKTPSFSVNGTNAAKDTAVRFFKDGTYRFVVTIENSAGLTATSNITVRVESTATYVGIDRHADEIRVGYTAQFNAMMYDQFRRPMRTQPASTWSVTPGPGVGTINANTGFFTAGFQTGHLNVNASALGLTGSVGVLVESNRQPGTGS